MAAASLGIGDEPRRGFSPVTGVFQGFAEVGDRLLVAALAAELSEKASDGIARVHVHWELEGQPLHGCEKVVHVDRTRGLRSGWRGAKRDRDYEQREKSQPGNARARHAEPSTVVRLCQEHYTRMTRQRHPSALPSLGPECRCAPSELRLLRASEIRLAPAGGFAALIRATLAEYSPWRIKDERWLRSEASNCWGNGRAFVWGGSRVAVSIRVRQRSQHQHSIVALISAGWRLDLGRQSLW